MGFTPLNNAGGTIFGQLSIADPNTNSGLEIGKLNIAETSFVDFHSSGTGSDYDNRLISIGGTSTPGRGTLQHDGAIFETLGLFRATNALSGGQSNTTVIQLGDSSYGFGMGNNAAEGFVVYRSGTALSSAFGHRFVVAGQELLTLRGDLNAGIQARTTIHTAPGALGSPQQDSRFLPVTTQQHPNVSRASRSIAAAGLPVRLGCFDPRRLARSASSTTQARGTNGSERCW
ncbi:MAG: hypothetical protein HC933_12440 [Pleurocapsa sp. SU_196_0]|nr:hypothetical protein [Pleurocapsa sp. SU_196_0]